MIPVRLRLRNFMSYGESVPPLDFTNIHLACLCGDNGHGKSALLDAITWSLWGKARISGRGGSTDDELIHLGRTEMEVEFEFDLDGNRYLVLRKRAIRASGKRRASTTLLEFQVADGDGWRALTGDSVTATERKIVEVLRLDYETFVNSAFILQGRADEFARKTAKERKQILGDLIGLSYYDALEERAREHARRFEAERREQAALIEEIDRDLAREPGYVKELERLNGVVDGLAADIERRNHQVAELQAARQELETKATQRAETQARIFAGPDAEGLTDRERALIAATDEFVVTRGVSAETWKSLSKHLSAPQLIEFCLLAAQYDGLAATISTLGVPLDFPD